jgi:hypothetical protein
VNLSDDYASIVQRGGDSLASINLLLLHFAFFFSAHRFLAAQLIFRFAAADTVRFSEIKLLLAFFCTLAYPSFFKARRFLPES